MLLKSKTFEFGDAKNIQEMSNVSAIKMQPITDEKYDFNSLL